MFNLLRTVILRPIVGLFLVLFAGVWSLENGLARTPPMGWMSWAYYECSVDCKNNPDYCLDEKLILSVADALYREGYLEAGYEYVMIDDCWSEKKRGPDGNLVPDRQRFPRGMRFIADYIHARGLKFGLYTSIDKDTCMRYPGSMGHLEADAKLFAEWQVDYIKVDACYVTENYLDTAFVKLGHLLNQTGRPMVYSCSWPFYKKYWHYHDFDFSKVVPLCNLWRDFHDIKLKWDVVTYIMQHYKEEAHSMKKFHGPGHWFDPDQLIVGSNKLTPGQNRIQMAVWAMLSAPLIFSCDIKKVSSYEKSLLLNPYLIAIAQDREGIMATPYRISEEVTLWVKPHQPKEGNVYAHSFAVVNLGRTPHHVSFKPSNSISNTADSYTVMDIFAGEMIRNITANDDIKVVVPGEDVIMYALYPFESYKTSPKNNFTMTTKVIYLY